MGSSRSPGCRPWDTPEFVHATTLLWTIVSLGVSLKWWVSDFPVSDTHHLEASLIKSGDGRQCPCSLASTPGVTYSRTAAQIRGFGSSAMPPAIASAMAIG